MVTPLPASPSYLQRPIIPVEDPGKGPGPLFLDQTAAEGSETTFGDRPPPPLPALYLEVWIWHRVQFKF